MTTQRDLMRDALVAALHPVLNPLGVSQVALYGAIEAALDTTQYDTLAVTVEAADQLVQAYQAQPGSTVPTGFEDQDAAWGSGRDKLKGDPNNGGFIYDATVE